MFIFNYGKNERVKVILFSIFAIVRFFRDFNGLAKIIDLNVK